MTFARSHLREFLSRATCADLVPVFGANIYCFALVIVLLTTGCGISGYGARETEVKRPVFHTVQSGENLYRIGLQYNVPQERIALLNNIRDPRSLYAGQRLLVGYRAGSSNVRTNSNSSDKSDRTIQPEETVKNVPRYGDGILAWPVAGGYIASEFGPRHGSFHDGIDIAASQGTAVYAAHSGLVIYSNNDLSGYGNLLIIRDKSGMTTVYAHNRRLLVSEGEQVKRGQKISEVGQTGHATGPHLHFEVRTKDSRGRYVAADPLPLFKKGNPPPLRYRVNEGLTPILAKLFK